MLLTALLLLSLLIVRRHGYSALYCLLLIWLDCKLHFVALYFYIYSYLYICNEKEVESNLIQKSLGLL